jgi:hypothetical protein
VQARATSLSAGGVSRKGERRLLKTSSSAESDSAPSQRSSAGKFARLVRIAIWRIKSAQYDLDAFLLSHCASAG